MFFKTLTAFLVLPGFVAGVVPYLLFLADPWRGKGYTLGMLVMTAGLFLLFWCVRDFYMSGKGTLAPWSPPKHLVMVGLYRFCRNPMYVGVLVLVGGWALFAASPLLVCYLVVLIFGFHFRVILYEEPQLTKLFGAEWESYSFTVPRWLPRYKMLRNKTKAS
jgi:protein-S-isoprenylcysteine O-methyltransferase Ste14